MRIAHDSPPEGLAGLGHSPGDSYNEKCADDRTARTRGIIVRKPRHVKGTGSIFTRPGSPYLYVGYWNGKRFVKESAKTTDRQVAQALLDKRREQMRTRRHVDPRKQERITVDELLNALQEHYKLHEQPAGKSMFSSCKVPLLAELGGMPAVNVECPLLESLQKKWKEAKVAHSTINKRLGVLHRAFVLAFKAGRIAAVPPFPTRLEELSAVRTGFVEPADFARFLAAISDTDVRDFIEWLGATGQRRGEARKLEWKYVHGDELHIPAPDTKGRKARVLPLVADLAEIIERRRALRRLDSPYIFHRDGKPTHEFRGPWNTAVEATGLRITPHDLRRSGVRNLIQAGVDRDVARAISGHRTEYVFARYNIVAPEQMADALRKVAAYKREAAAKAGKVVKLA